MQGVISTRRFALAAAALLVLGLLSIGASRQALARSGVPAPVHQTATTSHAISVSGHGEVSATPDDATITIGVQTKGGDAQSALSSNATKMNAVVAAIEGQGVAADHIQTSDLSLYRDSQSDTYVANHQLAVKLDSLDKVGSVLDASVGAGANNAWGVSFGLKNMAAERAQALKAAITDARSRADAMAAALGVSVTGVASVSESSAAPPIVFGGAVPAAPAASTSTQVQPGQLTIDADVTVSYTFG